jgi:hypothetical protein
MSERVSMGNDGMTKDENVGEGLNPIAGARTGRRRFLAYAGGAIAASGGLSLLGACGKDGTSNATPTPTPTPTATQAAGTRDFDYFNFALNFEFLLAQYFNYAAFGAVSSASQGGVGVAGAVTGGAQVSFTDPLVASYARELAADQAKLIALIQSLILNQFVAMPALNIDGSSATGAFALAAQAAGIANSDGTFNPYASDTNFLLGAFLLTDVVVTAYKGLSPLFTSTTYLDQAAGMLGTKAYHAGLIRSVLYRKGIESMPSLLTSALALSNARDGLDGTSDDDQGVGDATTANITPTDQNGLAFSRSTGQVLNIAYLTRTQATKGGFFPSGVNGQIFTSAAS